MGNTDFNYEKLDRPFDSKMARQNEGEQSENIVQYDDMPEIIASKTVNDNVWLKNWIKSNNYQVRSYGFLIDGIKNYIEANRLYIGEGGFEATAAGKNQAMNALLFKDVITFANDDLTPSVKVGNIFLTATGHGAARDITGFDDGAEGQVIFIIGAANGNKTTIKDGANLKINGDWTEEAEATLMLVSDGTNWYELGRLPFGDSSLYQLVDGSRAWSGTGAGFRDEDNMASNDATACASQQSIKAYVDDSLSSEEQIIKTFTSGETITDGDALFISDGTEILGTDESYDASTEVDLGNSTGGNTNDLAQSFEFDEETTIEKIKIKLKNETAPTDGIKISIQSDSGGDPSGVVLVSKTYDNTDLDGVLTEYTAEMDTTLTIAASTTYWIVLERTGAGDDTNKYVTAQGGDGTGYTNGGLFKTNVGSGTWVDLSKDLHFAFLVPITSGRAYRTRASNSDCISIVGIANAASTIGSSIEVVIWGIKTKVGWSLTTNTRYYLSDTTGVISTSVGTNIKIVGYTISTTELELGFSPGGRTDVSFESNTKSFTAGEAISVGEALGIFGVVNSSSKLITADAYVKDTDANSNFDGFSIVRRTDTGEDRYALASFTDLGDLLPATGTITAIKLTGFLSGGVTNDDDAYIFVNESSFNESTVTWNTKPTATVEIGDFGLTTLGVVTTGWVNITDANWTKLKNNGITIKIGSGVASGVAFDLGAVGSGNDFFIEIRYEDLSGKVYLAKATSTDYTVRFVGFATEDAIESASINVDIGGVNDSQAGLTLGAEYYLSDTFGEIADSAGSVSKKVGLALSATELLIKQTF